MVYDIETDERFIVLSNMNNIVYLANSDFHILKLDLDIFNLYYKKVEK